MVNISDKRFPLSESQDIVVNLTFDTTVLVDGSGGEERNINWQSPLLSYDLQKVILRRQQLDEIIQFFQDQKGTAVPFRYRDWSDYLVTAKPKQTRYGSTTQGLLLPLSDGEITEFVMVKRYIVPSCTHYREISLVNPKTVTVYDSQLNPIPYTDWVFNDGKFFFTTPPPKGQLLASGEFDVPVVFSSDKYEYRVKAARGGNNYSIEGLQLESVRIDMQLALKDELIQIDKPFALANYFNSLVGLEEQTEIITLISGFSKRTYRYQKSKETYFLGKYPLRDEELNYLIAFFRCVKGRGLRWKHQNLKDDEIPVRFDEDNLSLRLKQKGRYEIDGIKAIEVFEPFDIFQTPPFSLELEPIFIDPQNPDSDRLASSGNSFYNGSQGAETQKEATAFNISTYQAQGVSFNVLVPPGETGTNVNYYVANLFWAAGTLHLLVTTNNSQSAYRDRLIHYRLNLTNGWLFEYQAQSSLALRVFIVSGTDINRAVVFKTNTGVSQFFRANNAVAFGDTANYTNKTFGSLRFEIRNNGEFLVSFIDNQQLGVVYSVVPYMVYGDRAWFRDRVPYNERGTFDSITYFSNGGLPIRSNDLDNREYLYNFWTNYQTEPDLSEIIYHGDEAIFKYFANPVHNAAFYLNSGGDGSYLIKVLARYVCETGSPGCSTDERNDLIYFFLKSSYSAEPVLIDTQYWLTPSNPGDSNFIQIYNSPKTSCDRLGNQLVYAGNALVFYRGGSGYGINIASTIGFSVVSIRNKPAVTPYGFAIIEHSGNLFAPNTQINLAFVQHEDVKK